MDSVPIAVNTVTQSMPAKAILFTSSTRKKSIKRFCTRSNVASCSHPSPAKRRQGLDPRRFFSALGKAESGATLDTPNSTMSCLFGLGKW